jgi:hypothetical protein
LEISAPGEWWRETLYCAIQTALGLDHRGRARLVAGIAADLSKEHRALPRQAEVKRARNCHGARAVAARPEKVHFANGAGLELK